MAVGVIVHPSQDKIFIAKRMDGTPYESFWEYPGGKIEPGESATAALARELSEECDITVKAARPLIRISHDYPDRSVVLHVYLVTQFTGIPRGREGQKVDWVDRSKLREIRFLDGNRPITSAAMLDSRYAITNTRAYSRDTILKIVSDPRSSGLIQVRDKHLSDEAYMEWAKTVVQAARIAGKRVMLNRGVAGAERWLDQTGAQGIHLDSASLQNATGRPVGRDFWLSASCHNSEELGRAASIEVDFAVISPVQKTTSHPEAEPLGWQAFGEMCEDAPFPVFALGGVTDPDLDTVWSRGGQGVAMISGAWFQRVPE